MKLVSYLQQGREQLGFLIDDCVYDAQNLHEALPRTMSAFLNNWNEHFLVAAIAEKLVKEGKMSEIQNVPYAQIQLLAPVPHPTSCRDGYAFRQHVATARRNRKVPMIPEFDQFPIFYFTNHNSIKGPGEVACMPDHFERLDFELEAAIVICKAGRNIAAKEADEFIGGLMIMNDLSARQLQLEEMLLNLGPAKGKDFATTTGPFLVTLDELEPFVVAPKQNHIGKSWNLKMTCKVNDIQVSEGNLNDMNWTFAEIIERASYGADLYPGDIIGSGTVGTGCFLELNGTGKLNNPGYREQWLQPGDEVALQIDQLGTLVNTVSKENTNWSILNKKLR